MKIYIDTPNYNQQSTGVEAMHYFMYLLAKIGNRVYTNATIYNDKYFDHYPIHSTFDDTFDMIVLPEIVYGESYYKFDKPIFRWVLNYPGKLGGNKVYNEFERIYYWNCDCMTDLGDKAKEASFYNESTPFRLPTLDSFDFNYLVNPFYYRNQDMFFVYKGKNMHKHPKGAIEITRDITPTIPHLYNLLNNTGTLYSYDRHSKINSEALLCGCLVKLYNYNLNSWEDFTKLSDDHKDYRDYDKDSIKVINIINDFKKKANLYQGD